MENKERNEKILEISCEFLAKLNIEIENAVVEDMEGEENQVLVSVTTNQPGGIIGARGKNLGAVQLILSLIIKNKLGSWVRIFLDVNNYRREQKERLERMVESLVKKVKETGEPAEMAAMSSFERRWCHLAAAKIKGIVTESEGEGEWRHVVIKPKV